MSTSTDQFPRDTAGLPASKPSEIVDVRDKAEPLSPPPLTEDEAALYVGPSQDEADDEV